MKVNPKNQSVAGVTKLDGKDIQVGNSYDQAIPNAINVIPGENDGPGKVFLGNGEIKSGGEHTKLMGSTVPFPFSLFAGPISAPQIVPIVPAFEYMPFLKRASVYSVISLVK